MRARLFRHGGRDARLYRAGTGGDGIQRMRKLLLVAIVIASALFISFLINSINGADTLRYPFNIGPSITRSIDTVILWVVVNGEWFFDGVSDNLKIALGELRGFLLWIPWPVMVTLIFILGWRDFRTAFRP